MPRYGESPGLWCPPGLCIEWAAAALSGARDTDAMAPPTVDDAPRLRARWAAMLAVAGGLLGVGAFPRFGVWPLAFLSVALLSVSVDRRRCRTGAWLGFLYGLAFFVPVISWTGIYVGPVPWLILAAAEAGYCAGMGAALAALQRFRAAPLWIAAAWVLQEAVRDRTPFGGFPWARLAFSQAESPLRWFAALGGAPLVTFMVALGGGGLAIALRNLTWRGVAIGVSAVVATVLVGALIGWPLRPAPDRDGRTATIALVQGNVPDIGLAFEDRPEQVLQNHIAETTRLASEIKSGTVAKPSLIVWPEDSSDVDPLADPDAYTEINNVVRAVGIPILVGAILEGPGPNHRRNVGILWSPTTGPGSIYTKRHPVPFGEYIPLRSIARLVSSDVNLVTQDMVAGKGTGLVTGGPFPIGDVICFEVAYDDLVRSSVRAGAQLVVVQTNDATFGHSAETYQQLAMGQLRAVENGRAVVQVSTTGVSAVIGPDGSIRQHSGALYTPDVIVASVPLRTSETLATRLGDLPEYLFVLIAIGGLFWSVTRPVRARHRRSRAAAQLSSNRRDIDDHDREAANR
jgi:apolipoprotein N-acyltransferase